MHEIGEAARSIVMTLGDLVAGLDGARFTASSGGSSDTQVGAVRDDSRQVQPGDVFVAVKGIRSDGHGFVSTAIANGAVAIVVEHEVDAPAHIPQVIVPSGAVALGILVAKSLGDPAKQMTLVGITGTNGKTTTSYLVEAILTAAGHKVGVVGTVAYRWPGGSLDAPFTTPTARILHEAFAKMLAAGCTHVVMEVTSSALAMDRVAGLQFAVAGFSNLTQDHLDVHGTMDAYRDAKRRLFRDHLAGISVVNIDDPEGAGMAVGETLRVSTAPDHAPPADISVVEQESSVRGIRATLRTPTGDLAISAPPLIGHYNLANLALAVGIAEALGVSHEAIRTGIASLAGVPGRVERVVNDAELDILVDYAHTPDALRNVLQAVRPLTRKRLMCVFGCGGDRDPTKRKPMGAAVAELADLAFVTSDNPRTEEPRAILDQILAGVPRPHFVDPDRRSAIRAAVAEATPGDVIVIAGKGHEDYQILGTTKIHFDDREEATEAIRLRPRWTATQLTGESGGSQIHEPPSGTGRPITRVVIDTRVVAPGDCYVAIRGEAHDGHTFVPDAIRAGASCVIVDGMGRGYAPTSTNDTAPAWAIVVDDTRIGLGKIAAAHRKRWGGKLVAVTGSAGKTTTKELIRSALSQVGPTHGADGSLNNETGVPLTLLGLRGHHSFGVVEMGMRGLGEIEYLTKLAEPDVAVVVNAGTAHIERLGSTDAIAQAKSEIWMGLRDGGTVVRPVDDARLARWATEHRPDARHVTFGEAPGTDVRLVDYGPSASGSRLVIDAFGERRELVLALVGKHVALDACCAIAAARAAGASLDQAIAGVMRAKPPAMRGEVVEVAGRHVIVDCYNANPASMAASLRALAERTRRPEVASSGVPVVVTETGTRRGLGVGTPSPDGERDGERDSEPAPGRGIAVVGDMLELGELAISAHRDIGELARSLGIGVIALGEHAQIVASAADGEVAADPAAAAARALSRTRPGDWILLKASRGMRLERVLAAMQGAI